MISSGKLVSVVIIFLNAEEFLAEAIDSVLAQTYPEWELLLVDDGSTDKSSQIARSYIGQDPSRIRYLEHPGHVNRGAAASRNFGISHAQGELIAVLDADDVWLPNKLERQVSILEEHESVSLVCGRPIYWFSWRGRPEDQHADFSPRPGLPLDVVVIPPEPLLMSYPLAPGSAPCPSDFLFRRSLIEEVGGFEESFHGTYQLYEDQVFLTKVYLNARIFVADECWLLYRRHDSSCMTTAIRDGAYNTVRKRYLHWLDRYLEEGRHQDPRVYKALERATLPYNQPMRNRVSSAVQRGKRMGRKALSRFLPEPVLAHMPKSLQLGVNHPNPGQVRFGSLARTRPISSHWGWDRGLPVDRYYIEAFINAHAEHVRGRVLEVGDDRYSGQFANERIERVDILHVVDGNPKATIVGDLATASHIPSDTFDCIILTHTLQYVFDLDAAFRTLRRILKPGGVLLVTVPAISRTEEGLHTPRLEQADRWRTSWYWNFTRTSLARLASEHFPPDHMKVESFGNVWAATAFLYGVAAEELSPEALSDYDPAFAVVVTLATRKPTGPA
jgi:glycosyltransferase involved in cell wall biosynthesis/SAM-dependent methyltransferase